MDFLNQIFTFFKEHQQLLIVALGFFLVYTKRIDLSFLLNLLKSPTPGPTPDPNKPFDLSALLQLLLPMLLKAKAEGNKEAEDAILKVMGHSQHQE